MRKVRASAMAFSLSLIAGIIFLPHLLFSPLDGGPLDSRPRLEASAESPGGELSVRVYRQRNPSYSLYVGAELFVKVYGRDGGLLSEKLIGSDGAWDELDARYQITFDGGQIKVVRLWCRAGCADANQVIIMGYLRAQ